jgi:hypothetical protein
MTGAMPVDHHAHCITSGVDDLSGTGARSRPLNEALPTLAEHFADKGYQTVAVSGNPVVSEQMGLLRGFETVDVAPAWGAYFGPVLPARVDALVSQLDPERSTFLFVNIGDAHQPWPSVPGAVGLRWNKTDENREWARYMRGELSEAQWLPLKARIDLLYDRAVQRADASLGTILEAHCRERCRVVITSDHGELLGEHRLLDHGQNVWDENAVVPLYTSTGTLPEGWISALDAHPLLLGDKERHAPISESWPHVRRCARTHGEAFCSTEVARWGDQKMVWSEGVTYSEVAGVRTPAEDGDLAERGARLLEDGRDDGDMEFEVEELLRAAGYLD